MADYLKEAKKAQQNGDFLRAGDLYLLARLNRQAITAYIQGAHYINAARLLEKEQDWRAAGRYYGQAGKFDRAAELFRKADDFAMASNMFEKANQLASASEMAASAKDFDRAARLAEQAGQREKAAEYYGRRALREIESANTRSSKLSAKAAWEPSADAVTLF